MKHRYPHLWLLIALVPLAAVSFYCAAGFGSFSIEKFRMVPRAASIEPDYTNLSIPANIAPLNFSIKEAGTQFFVRIYSEKGAEIKIISKKPEIIIPVKKWRRLLDANRGGKVFFDVYVKDRQNQWEKYQTVTNTIAQEDIDAYIVYRLIKPAFNYWKHSDIHQRCLEDYYESVVFDGQSFAHSSTCAGCCANCHTFLNNSPDKMFLGVRSDDYGAITILKTGKTVDKIGTKFGYTAWHPSGRVAVYSVNKVDQFFHTNRVETRDVLDLDSRLLYYLVDTKTVSTHPAISDVNRLETFPAWSPDGKYLYFCSAPVLWKDRNKVPPDNYEKVKYDLMRIGYDVEQDKWGELETVLSSEKTGLSILLPRISPDGRYLLFCMCKYSCFPLYQQDSDIYMMDLKTGEYNKLDINSDYPESWHSWSSNSRWIAFSSKRQGLPFTRTYISYVDKSGKAHKPFILPQKDPAFYDSFAMTCNVPEFITAPIDVSNREIARAIQSSDEIKVLLPITGATPKESKATQEYTPRE
jgi:dipeptidyl aminopeptidase/acylaminoacyl peptidase